MKYALWLLFCYFAVCLSVVYAQDDWKSLNKLGMKYYDAGDYPKAQIYWEKAKILAEKEFTNEHLNYATSCNNLGLLYDSQGKYTQTEPLYLEAKKIFSKVLGKEHPWYAVSCNNLAELYKSQGKYAQAEPLLIEAKEIKAKVLGKEHPDYALSCNNLAGLYYEQGKYAQAELLLIEAKEIWIKALGKEHLDYALSCNNLAVLYKHQGKYAQAKALYLETKEIKAKVLGKEHPDYALSCNNLAGLYHIQGKYAQAEPLLVEAKEIWAKALGKAHPLYANSCNNLGGLYDRQDKYTQAEPLFLEARDIYAKVFGKEHSDYALSCNNLAGLYYRHNKYVQATLLYKEASQTLLKQTEVNFSNLSEKEKGLFLATFKFNFEAYNSFTLKAHQQIPSLTAWLYDNTLAIKGLLFQSSEKIRQNIMNSGNQNLIDKYQTWKEKKDYLAKVYTLTIADKQKQGIDEKKLEEEANQIEKELSTQASTLQGFGNLEGLSGNKAHYTWQDVQKTLKPHEAAIEIIRTRYYDKKWTDSVLYIALIIKPETQGQSEMVVLGNGKELEGKYLSNYKNSIKAQKTDKYSYQQFWQRLSQALYKGEGNSSSASWRIRGLYLSVDGVYNQINLNTLQNPETGQYLGEEIDIEIVGSTRDLVKRKLKPTTAKPIRNAVLMGYPAYNDSTAAATQLDYTAINQGMSRNADQMRDFLKGGKIDMLEGTKQEIDALTPMLRKANVKVDTFMLMRASEVQLKAIKNPQILHLATHGFFLKDVDFDLDDKTGFMGMETNKVVENPLFRSGLLFAGCKRSLTPNPSPLERGETPPSGVRELEDGVLTAYEAMNLNLDETDLVVMSACETGLGDVQNGEGVYGLQRAFQQAGAKTVLMSLWTVSDEATQELMTLFYQNWISKKQSKREAFKNAQNELKKKYPEPYFWGAFVMVGE